MANQLDLGLRALDANGYIAPGAKATVTLTGTSTLIDVWTDVGGTIAGANPIIADGNGYWPQRFVDETAKVVITDADDVTLQTLDPAPTALGTGSAASEVSFTPTVELPFTNVQDAIEGANIDGLTASAAELNLMDGFAAVETTATDVTTAFPNSRALFRGRGWTYAAAQATTSGTAFDFTGIPSWVTEIKLLFSEVSLSSTGDILVQIGDGGGIEGTGYVASSVFLSDAVAVAGDTSTSGYLINAKNAATEFSGEITMTKFNSTTWVSKHVMRRGAGSVAVGGGIKTLSGTLDRVRVTRVGTDTFDLGILIAMWR